MHPCRWTKPDRPIPTRVARAIVVALAMGATTGIMPGSPVPAARAGAHGGHTCACGMDCRGSSCCCTHDAPKGPSPRPAPPPFARDVPSAAPDTRPTGPCFADGRCGDPAAPTRAVTSPAGKAAALAGRALPIAGRPTRIAAREGPAPRPLALASRLERPPRTDETA
ncbi:hypothetical protein OJF2_74590 [Aquisphaera giovannonii]|uniref:Uncharacterized protein n=1 Tax=Aquisphaera giovannonii TaxID=406548 RepID=A0A5B9WF16_9BACT|nr:hypothetical protein [Aquisphaera giovannonii]QEH38849.1 hypothetical protein OJF2_74590 [Aquisphaera giovannonii]